MQYIRQTPHCDSKILHAPGDCEYCDKQPEWQELRQLWGIGFTGHSDEEGNVTPCPSELVRPLSVINRWPGNVAHPKQK